MVRTRKHRDADEARREEARSPVLNALQARYSECAGAEDAHQDSQLSHQAEWMPQKPRHEGDRVDSVAAGGRIDLGISREVQLTRAERRSEWNESAGVADQDAGGTQGDSAGDEKPREHRPNLSLR